MNEKNQNMNQSRDALNTLKLPDKSGVPTGLTTNSTPATALLMLDVDLVVRRSIYFNCII